MSEIYVDTDKLQDRLDRGSAIREILLSDMEELRRDAAACSSALKASGENARAEILDMYLKELENVVRNITDVCLFDRAALERYRTIVSRIDDIVDAID